MKAKKVLYVFVILGNLGRVFWVEVKKFWDQIFHRWDPWRQLGHELELLRLSEQRRKARK